MTSFTQQKAKMSELLRNCAENEGVIRRRKYIIKYIYIITLYLLSLLALLSPSPTNLYIWCLFLIVFLCLRGIKGKKGLQIPKVLFPICNMVMARRGVR